ncbi:MAG: phosphatase PAP2 family protein [Bryobacterales bacterium]|nr:phosphatase PAP2 family protein [Bryobacterales bacterium]MBV9401557.1 phosphatase PAP2 family protein [Bryobacterales bacterium]
MRFRNPAVLTATLTILLSAASAAQTETPESEDVAVAAPTSDADSQNPPAPPSTSEHTNPSEDARDRIYYPGDTENAKPLAKKLVFNILLDQKEIWTSPFRMNRHDAMWWALFGGATAALIATDHKTINTFENSPQQVSWGNHISNIGAAYTLLPLTAGFYAYGAVTHNTQAREVGVLSGQAMLDALIVSTVLKYAAGRVRPDSTTGERSQFFDRGDSFPSGHAIETWAFASVIAHEYKRYGGWWVPYVSYGLATTVSLARFAAQRHYASDILAGAGMGWFIGRYVYQTHEYHAGHPHAWAHPAIYPQFDPTTRTYAAAVQFGK